jgi:hypothetical protein
LKSKPHDDTFILSRASVVELRDWLMESLDATKP